LPNEPCVGCGRAPADADDHLDWEAVVRCGRVVLICACCVTQAERREIEEDWIAAEEDVGRPEADGGWG
jgi:hypothetical protein